jgi:hypothetical protein
MILSYWTLAVALSLSLVAAWYSIIGLTAIFAAAVLPIIIMGGIMEVAKVTVTLWLHEYWQYCKRSMKIQLTFSVIVLMFITSMGIFGFLSKAHLDQTVPTGDVAAQVQIIDEKIKIERDNIENARSLIAQLDGVVNALTTGQDRTARRSDGSEFTISSAERALSTRRSQAKDRAALTKQIEVAQTNIIKLQAEKAPIASELRKVEAEVGPIKYIASLIYGDNPDANLLEKSVRWVIIILVLVFDPLAIMMVLAATESIKWERQGKRGIDFEEDSDVMNWFNHARERARFWDQQPKEEAKYEQDDGPLTADQVEQIKEQVKDELPTGNIVVKESLFEAPEVKNPNAPGLDVSNERPGDYLTDPDKEAMRRWKEANPNDTIKHQRDLFEHGKIDQLPWSTLGLEADNVGTQGQMTGFGTSFPVDPAKGDMFLRVDQLPSALYKHNGKTWIAVDKSLSDQYAYDTAYIDHLIAKIESGEYDPELLSPAEQDQIEHRLKNK